MQKVKAYIPFLLVLGLLFPASEVYALDPLATYTSNSVSVIITPDFPESGKEVTIRLTSYATDLERADISWTVGDKVIASGVGVTDVTITAPAGGQTTTVNVTVKLINGGLVQKSIPISPQDVDMLVESIDGYTPPFYKGRSLPIREGLVKVSAIPHFANVDDSKDAVYNWNQNTKPLPDFSGYGKRYLVYKNAFLNSSDTITVVASSRSGSTSGKKQKTINLYTPKVLLYEDHPSQGLLLGRALTDTFTLTDAEATFVAFPYFSSLQQYNNPLSSNIVYTWNINGSETTPTEKNRITLRKPEGVEGTAKIEVSVKNALSSFQKEASTETRISF